MISLTNGAGTTDIYKQNYESRYRFYTSTDINSKWTIGLNLKGKTIKLLEDNIGKNLDDLGCGDAFLYTPIKTQSIK